MSHTLILESVGKVGTEVTLKGWVNARRNMGKIIFLDLRDRSGIVQVVGVPAELDAASLEDMTRARLEWVIEVTGTVKERGEKQKNHDVPTGTIELLAKSVKVLSESEAMPFEITQDTRQINEELRLKYRYLDLRSERVKKNLDLRQKANLFLRNYFTERGFWEIETPILTKGTPEGSREFLVPSRLYKGEFYVLPQSPQQFKQLLMVGGVEKYFQLARCFRDEDSRGDRQPEFTQLDIEMSFVEQEDVIALNEAAIIAFVHALAPEKKIQQIPFPRLTYAEAMAKYNSDKPDLREDKNDPNLLAFCWVTDFPFFEKSEESSTGWTFTHNPFSAPIPAHREWLMEKSHIEEIITTQYDVVLNGFELGGGSIRNHRPEALRKVFEIMGINVRFGHMLEAFKFGAPPHGGIAWGIDRLLAELANEANIREVIAFAKTSDAKDMMMGAPSPLPEKALKEANIKTA